MDNNPTASENQYAEDLAQEKAGEIVKSGKSESAANDLIDHIIDADVLHWQSREKFRQMVWKKVEEMKEKAKDDRERKIIEEYEGKLQTIGGKMRPAGVQEGFKVRVRAGKFEIGNIGRTIWGHSINADKLAGILDEVKDLETKIEKNKAELEILKAARESTATIIGVERLGLTVGVTKVSLVKDIYKNKYKSQGWTSLFSTELNLLESYRAARKIKEDREKEYRKGRKKEIAELEERGRSLEKKKAILEAALEKVEALRENGRDLFNKTFGEQLEALNRNRDAMDESDYNTHIKELREKVKAFGKSIGIVNMEFFLNEALGIKPEISSDGKVIYQEPQTEVTKGRERVMLTRWWRGFFHKDISDGDLSSLIESLRKTDFALMKELSEGKLSTDNEMIGNVFRFLLIGKLSAKANGGKEVLSPERRADLSVGNFLKYLKLAKKVSAEFKGDESRLDELFVKFANGLPSRYKVADFEYVYQSLDRSLGRKEISEEREKEHNKELAEAWGKLTGEDLFESDGKLKDDTVSKEKISGLMTLLESGASPISEGPDVFLSNVRKMDKIPANFMKMFFTKKYGSEVEIKDIIAPPTSENVLNLYKRVKEFFKDVKPDEKEMKTLCAAIKDGKGSTDEKYKELTGGFNEKSIEDGTFFKALKTYLANHIRSPEETKKKNKNK